MTWIKITPETLPIEEQKVLLFDYDDKIQIGIKKGKYFYEQEIRELVRVDLYTHWMALPAPPKDE